MKIGIDKEVLFQLIASHSRLAQAEYNRNPGYNNEHFSHIVEDVIIKELTEIGLLDEYLSNLDIEI